MNHIEFIEKHVRDELIKQGFTVAVAQGGHFRPSICTSACRKPVAKGGFLMTYYGTRNSGQRSSSFLQTNLRRNALSVGSNNQVCSEMAKAAVLEHQRLSIANNVGQLRGHYDKH
ncbi:TPA: hypothetical protein LSH72_001267 [Klebsiella oxytoca]|nr:hypothetical protein [Klebsiella oxytoca]HBL6909085.1 hypothetical protein [Klebsiella oxytoca]